MKNVESETTTKNRVLTYWGRIHPERALIAPNEAVYLPCEVNYGHGNASLEGWVAVSQFTVRVTADHDNPGPFEFKALVEEFVRSFVDTIGYKYCRGYDLEVVGVCWPGGVQVFGIGEDKLKQKVGDLFGEWGEVWKLGAEHTQLRLALANLREAVRMSGDTGFFSHRAIEAVEWHFHEENDHGDGAAKDRMRKALCVSKTWVKRATKYGGKQRHGKPLPMTEAERVDAMEAAWKVVERLIIYLANGSSALDSSSYPEL